MKPSGAQSFEKQMTDCIGRAPTADQPRSGDQGGGSEGKLDAVMSLLIALSTKLDDVESRLGSRLGEVESRLGGVASRLGGVEQMIATPVQLPFVPERYDRLTVVFIYPRANGLTSFQCTTWATRQCRR